MPSHLFPSFLAHACPRACLILILACGSATGLRAQAPAVVAPSPPEVQRTIRQIQEVPMLIASREFENALRYLEAGVPILKAMAASDAGIMLAYGKALYMKGVCQLELEKYGDASETFETYISAFPNDVSATTAKLLLGEAYLYLSRWQDILRVVPPVLESRMINQGELALGHQLVAEAYFQLEQWEMAIPSLRWVFLNNMDPTTRMAAVGQLSVCLVRLEKFNDLYRVMPFIHRTSAKFNIPLNMTLLEEGDDLLDAKRPDHALLLYRLVIPYSELKRQIVNRVGSVQREVTQLEDKKSGLADDTRRMRELTRTLEALKEEEEELDGVPDYDEELKIRLGDAYYALNRFEEAIQLYLSIQKAKPDHELAQRAMYSAYITAYSGQENERALEIARAYMDRYPNGEFWDDVTLHAVALLSDMERWFEAVDVSDRALAGNPEHAAIDNILYMKAYAQFMMSLIRESMATFEKLINEHGRSSFRPNAEYWHALGHLFLQQYMEAKQEFTAFTTQYKRGPLREDAYFRRGVAEYGLGDFESAKSTFESFVGEYPTSILTSEALAMVGDILASWGQLDEAMDHYRRAVDKAINMVQADYATFQQARTYELEQKWQEIIDLFTAYNARFPDDANYTEATYWMGNAYKQLNRPDKALELFYDSIVTYGNDLKAYGIDFILRDLAEEVRQVRAQNAISKLALDMRERLNDELDKALADNKQTLLLRLEGLMYETSDNEELRAAIRQRMLQERNIPLAAPISLVTMGKMAREAGDAALTGKIYEHFLEKYEDSDLILDALEGLSVARIEEKRYVEALDLLKSITDRYPTLPQAAEAYLRMGDIHRMDGQPDKAIDTYTLILTVKDWRGELWPRALLKVGDTHAELNKHAEAFGFYQRVYVMYVGYPEQAAEAYTKSARMLEAMGKIPEARATLKEMLDQAALARQPIAQEARSLLLRLP